MAIPKYDDFYRAVLEVLSCKPCRMGKNISEKSRTHYKSCLWQV